MPLIDDADFITRLPADGAELLVAGLALDA